MLREKISMLLIAFFLTQESIAFDNFNHMNGDSYRRTSSPIAPPSIDEDDDEPANQQGCKFATYSYSLPPGLILPIHLLIDEDEPKPASEPFVDYSMYKVGAQWPDWDWADPETLRKEQEKMAPKQSPPPYFPRIVGCALLTCLFYFCRKNT